MKRYLFNFAAAISLLLGLAMIGLTLRGLWSGDSLAKFRWNPQRRILSRTEIIFTGNLYLQIRINPGRMASDREVNQVVSRIRIRGEMEWRLSHQDMLSKKFPQLLMGFHFQSNSGTLPSGLPWSIVEIEMPYWPLILLSGVMPMMWIVSWQRTRRQQRAGCCRNCSYDLRATPERCPECGTAV